MSKASDELGPRRFHVRDYNVVFEWSPRPRWRIPELAITVVIDCDFEGRVTPQGLGRGLSSITALASQLLARFEASQDHPLPLGPMVDQLVITKNKDAPHTEVTIPTAAKLLGESPQTVRRAVDKGLLPSRKTPGGKRFVPVRAIAERRVADRKPRPQNAQASARAATTPPRTYRAAEAIRLSGLSRATFYRMIRRLVSEGVLALAKRTPHQWSFSESDIEKIRHRANYALPLIPSGI